LVFIFAEHILFLLKAAIYYFVPDVPERVRLHLLRQEYVSRVHLEGRPMPDEYPGYPSDESIAASVSATVHHAHTFIALCFDRLIVLCVVAHI
jgi:hypothetical protein